MCVTHRSNHELHRFFCFVKCTAKVFLINYIDVHTNFPRFLLQILGAIKLRQTKNFNLYTSYCTKTHPIHTKFLAVAGPDEAEKSVVHGDLHGQVMSWLGTGSAIQLTCNEEQHALLGVSGEQY